MTPPAQPPAPSPEQEKRIEEIVDKHNLIPEGVRGRETCSKSIKAALTELAADFAKERAELESKLAMAEDAANKGDEARTTMGAMTDALAAMEEKVREVEMEIQDSKDLRKGLTGDVSELSRKLDAAKAKLEEKDFALVNNAENHEAELTEARTQLDSSEVRFHAAEKHCHILITQLASTQAKLEESEEALRMVCIEAGGFDPSDGEGQPLDDLVAIIKLKHLQAVEESSANSLTLAAALKQAREALVNLRGWAVANTTKPIHDLLAVTDAALSTHPDSALLGRVRDVLERMDEVFGECEIKQDADSPWSYLEVWKMVTQLRTDLGGQQP